MANGNRAQRRLWRAMRGYTKKLIKSNNRKILSLFKVTSYLCIEWNLKITVSETASIPNFLIFLVGTVDGLVCTDYWFW